VTRIWDGVKDVFGIGLDTLWSMVVDVDWGWLGMEMIMGIANGISGAAQFLASAAVEAAKRAFDAAKEWLQIGSPSKRAEDELGEPTGEGFGIGLKRSLGGVAQNVRGSMVDIFSAMGNQGSEMLNRYFRATVEDGDFLNDWLVHIPEKMRGAVESIGRYIAATRESGDSMNDLLMDVPEELRGSARATGNMLTLFSDFPDIINQALPNLANMLLPQLDMGEAGSGTPFGNLGAGQTGGNSYTFSITQNFYGEATAEVVKEASESGILASMRNLGMR
jgi:hypothetical protein